MDIRHLRYFLAVAKELSFSRAAESLHMAQPPLSQQIKDLERETGLQLFDRSSRQILLTAAGRDFLVEARQVIESVERLERNAKLRAAGQLGRLAIGVNTAIVTPHFFATMLRKFQRGNPGIEFSLVDYNSGRQIEALLSGEIDVGFLRPATLPPVLLQTHHITRESMRMAVPEDHALARQKMIRWADMENERIIIVQPDVARDFYDAFFVQCRTNGFEPRIQQHVNNISTQLWLVSAGMGLAPMPITPGIVSGVKFVALPSDAPAYEIALAWRKNDSSTILSHFVEYIKNDGRRTELYQATE